MMDLDTINDEATESGKDAVRQSMGALRGFASQYTAANKDVDEEEFFATLRNMWIKGFLSEFSKVFGSYKTSKLLDPFNGKSKRS